MEEHLGRAAEGVTLWWSGRVPVTALTTKVEEVIMLLMVPPELGLGTCWDVPELDLLRFISWLALGIPGNITVRPGIVLFRDKTGIIYANKIKIRKITIKHLNVT